MAPSSSISDNRYAVASSGQRFLVVTPLEGSTSTPITVVLNWTAEVKKER